MNTPTNPCPGPADTKRGPAEYFTGTAWVTMLAGPNPTVGDVTFEPGTQGIIYNS